jgi:beta-galactosidase
MGKKGLLVWAENGHTSRTAPSAGGVYITREMVRPNFNHPSIVFWSCGNET